MSTTIKSVTGVAGLLSVAAAGYLFWAPASPMTSISNSTQECERLLANAETSNTSKQCLAPANKITWTNWVKGESRSAQFHFIDLFELLFSSSDTTNSNERFNQQSAL